MWLQVKAPATQTHSADGTCQLQIFVKVKSQQSFVCVCVCVPGCSLVLIHTGIRWG